MKRILPPDQPDGKPSVRSWEFVSPGSERSSGTRHADPGTAKRPVHSHPGKRLKADAMYEVNGELVRSGRALMHGGLNFPRQTGDFKAVEFYLKEVK